MDATDIAFPKLAAKCSADLDRHALAQRLADLAVSALVDEAMLTPKPGLVDLRSRGAHKDMNWALMCHSAWSLHPCFYAMALAGQEIDEQIILREQIGRIGREGESAMMRATGGVNTHRGAIWALGLLVSAAAQDASSTEPNSVAARAGALARLPDRSAPAAIASKGEQACRKYGVGGARAQAQADFPHITGIALPRLHRSRNEGASEDAARIDALISIIAELDDTCVLSRGGEQALHSVRTLARAVIDADGFAHNAGKRQLRLLEQDLLELQVSPGGAADLLAAALFLDRLQGLEAV